MSEYDELIDILSKYDIPKNKRDLMKDSNIRWLRRNIKEP